MREAKLAPPNPALPACPVLAQSSETGAVSVQLSLSPPSGKDWELATARSLPRAAGAQLCQIHLKSGP